MRYSNSQRYDMIYFLSRLLMVFLPLVMWQLVELFVLPSTFFTFRPWESVRVQNGGLFRGPFYPNQNIEMQAAGDLDPQGPRLKRVRFQTDGSGYRNPQEYGDDTRYDFLLVGDSHFVGASVDEADTLRAVLEREHGKKAYNCASVFPESQAFMHDPRIQANPPRFVVLEFRPEDVVYGRYATWPTCSPVNDTVHAKICKPVSHWERFLFNSSSDAFRTVYDRAHTQLGFNYLRARLMLARRRIDPPLTIQQAEANFRAVIESLFGLSERLRERGSGLIVLLMPVPYPAGVGDLVARHLENRVPMVHWQAGSPYAHEADMNTWYEVNDSHWRESSIVVAAKRIVAVSEGR